MPRVLESPRLLSLVLPAALEASLVAHALATPEVEVCGLLGGVGPRALTRYAIANVADEPATTFFMEPRAQLRAMQAMRRRGEALLGIYHSHPAGPALPSARDVEFAAYPGVAYLIVSLLDRQAPALGCFIFEGAAFAPLAVERP